MADLYVIEYRIGSSDGYNSAWEKQKKVYYSIRRSIQALKNYKKGNNHVYCFNNSKRIKHTYYYRIVHYK